MKLAKYLENGRQADTLARLFRLPDGRPPAGRRARLAQEHVREWLLTVMLYIANVPLDIVVRPQGEKAGVKRSASISVGLGGPAGNGGPVCLANGVATSVIGVQGGGWPAKVCRHLLRTAGLSSYIVERTPDPGAMTVAMPGESPGSFELSVQRLSPPTESELSRALHRFPGCRLICVGPMEDSAGSEALHFSVTDLPVFSAMTAHSSLLKQPERFHRIGSLYKYVQMNLDEARLLDPTVSDLERIACKVRFLLGDRTEFAITNGPDQGLLWADSAWHPIRPVRLAAIASDIGAGDCWGAAYLIARRFHAATVDAALAYAGRAVAAKLRGNPIPRY